MIEFRILVMNDGSERLQFRKASYGNRIKVGDRPTWGEWQDIPRVQA